MSGGLEGETVSRQSWAWEHTFCFFPVCCPPCHWRRAICFKEVGKVLVKPVTQPVMVEGSYQSVAAAWFGMYLFLGQLGNLLQRQQNKSWSPLKCVCERPPSFHLALGGATVSGFCFSPAAPHPQPPCFYCVSVFYFKSIR